ncbi:MAG: AAA family ATPase [Bacteroidales bacterium]|nr:AAA family ATPase [Bacteroidales bacterium]
MKKSFEKSFVFGVAVSDYNFVGREFEIKQLASNFTEGINTILVSPRRIGKTSLVNVVRQKLDKNNVIVVSLDIFACKDEYAFYNLLAESVLLQTASKADLWMDEAKEFLSRLTPKIGFATTPDSDIKISLGITPKTHTPDEILNLVETIAQRKQKRIVVCIDEFQQIGEFADSSNIQKRLRAVWQQQKLTSYCLFGSKRHLMNTIFQKRNMPLYQFGDMMFLKTIPAFTWVEYIVSHFKDRNKTISEKHAEEICNFVECYSSYVQQLAWHVFSLTDEGGTVTDEIVEHAKKDLFEANELLFLQQIDPLTSPQMNFLKALANGVNTDFGKAEIRETYSLGSYSNIARLKDAMLKRDLIDVDGKFIYISDPIFKMWFKEKVGWRF